MRHQRLALTIVASSLLLAAPMPSAVAGDGCAGDVTADGVVDVEDLLEVIFAWGECDPDTACPADIAGDDGPDGVVNVQDLIEVIINFGPCDGTPGCQEHADCDDGDPCTIDICVLGTCLNLPLHGCGDGG